MVLVLSWGRTGCFFAGGGDGREMDERPHPSMPTVMKKGGVMSVIHDVLEVAGSTVTTATEIVEVLMLVHPQEGYGSVEWS